MNLRKNKNISSKSIKERLFENMEKENSMRKQNMQKDIDSKRFFNQEENEQFIKARDASQHLKIAKNKDKDNPVKNWRYKTNAARFVEECIIDKQFIPNQYNTLIKTNNIKILHLILKNLNEFCYYSNEVLEFCYYNILNIFDKAINVNDDDCIAQMLYMVNSCITYKAVKEIEIGLCERLFSLAVDKNFHNRNVKTVKPQTYYNIYLINIGSREGLLISGEKLSILYRNVVNEINMSFDEVYFCILGIKVMTGFFKLDVFEKFKDKKNELFEIASYFIDVIFNFYDSKIYTKNKEELISEYDSETDIILFQHLAIHLLSTLIGSFANRFNDAFEIIFNKEKVEKITKIIELIYDYKELKDMLVIPLLMLLCSLADSKFELFMEIFILPKTKNLIIERNYKFNNEKIIDILTIIRYILEFNNLDLCNFYLNDKNVWEFINIEIENNTNPKVIEETLNLIMEILSIAKKFGGELEKNIMFNLNQYEINIKIEKLCNSFNENIPEKATGIIQYFHHKEQMNMDIES